MGIELKDFRGKVTPETACALEAVARATGKQQQEIAREVLHAWALDQMRAATVLRGLMLAEGLTRDERGGAGRGRA